MTLPAVMPLISRNVPAFTNDDFSGAFPASHANDAVYGGTDYWRCAQTPTANANSGTLIAPVYLAYDLSGVAASSRGQVVVAWYTDASNGAYRPDLISQNINNLAVAYTIDVNPAAGGTLPTSGWVTKATVTGTTPYHSRQHSIDMTGNNWVRINVTAISGSASNNNAALNMDVHDAHAGVQDDWIFFGDSITQRGFMHDEQGGIGNILPQQINAIRGAYFPVWECGGMGGWTATDLQPNFATFLALFPGKYVGINMGTNDANLGGTFVTNFSSNMTNMVQQVLTAGKIPIIPHIPWLNTTAQAQTNVITLNGQIDSIIAANPGTLAGPDLYAFFSTHQSDISGDGLHPTDPALSQGNGYVDYRQQWVNWAIVNVYTAPQSNPPVAPVGVTSSSPYYGGRGPIPLQLPAYLSLSSWYAIGGTTLGDQPTICTAPLPQGNALRTGSTFILLFQSPSSATQSLLSDGSQVQMTFPLFGGRVVTGPILLASTLSGTTFQVVCTLLANIPFVN